MNLCGVHHTLEPYAWLPFVVASFVFLAPMLVPWRIISIAVLVILTVLIGSMAFDGFFSHYTYSGEHRDICDPPYFDEELRKIAATSLWALAVAASSLFVFTEWRSERGVVGKMQPMCKFYVIATLPALLMFFV